MTLSEEISILTNKEFDNAFYLSSFTGVDHPSNPFEHYYSSGWREYRDPCRWFSTYCYLAANYDVAQSGMNPFVHYIMHGRNEGRNPNPVVNSVEKLQFEQSCYTKKGYHFEDFCADTSPPKVKAICYYLPQFHACPENDLFWGPGFTEWRNVARGLPRYRGHIQPRIPLDFGYYDLSVGDVFRRQIQLAEKAGIFGFCFYYYAFSGRRILERPVERMLSDQTLEFPFCLMWANEPWTRNWDGGDKEVLIPLDYSDGNLDFIAADISRHFSDVRYIKIEDRPIFFIYSLKNIIDPKSFLRKLREKIQRISKKNPFIYCALTNSVFNPLDFGFDGGIQFPPHLLGIESINHKVDFFAEKTYQGRVYDYVEVSEFYLKFLKTDYPVISCCAPNWDNETRQPSRGLQFAYSSPYKFEQWVRKCVKFACENSLPGGHSIVAVNAWNEWAEGAFLEPDVHYGHAYINALSRGLR